jgi:tetratricopeptide (TPR) repeat protein
MKLHYRFLAFAIAVAVLQGQVGREALAARSDVYTAHSERAKGTVAVNLGNYVEAIEHFSRAYSLNQDPLLLFSLAQAYRLSVKPEKALATYSAFLRAVGNNPKYRGQIERAADEIESITSYMLSRPGASPTREKPSTPEAAPAAADDELAPLVKAAIEPSAMTEQPAEKAEEPAETAAALEQPTAPVPVAKAQTPPPPAFTFVQEEKPAESPSKPIYKSWIFWTSTAVLLAAGGVAALLLTRPVNETPGSTYGTIRVLP